MLTSVLRRPYWPAPPTGTYYACAGFSSFLYALTFTLSMVYYVKDVGLSPLQMVLVGTVLEASCFLFEIPTGVVADLAMVLGTVAAGALGLLSLRLPMIVSGTGFVLLAVALLLVMREDNFVPTPKGDRETFAHLTSTLVHGLEVARRRPVVRNFFLISIIVGLSSEAFDRLWTVRILDDFRLPTLFGTSDPAVWFTFFALVGTLLSLTLTTSVVVNKVSADRVNDALHPNGLLALLTLAQVGGIVGLAVGGDLWLALAAMWARNAALAVAQPIQAAWLNRNVDSQARATVLSMNAQADAIGQVAGGPPLGALANRISLDTALVTSAVILSPTALLYLRLRPTRKDADADAGTSAASGAEH